MAMPDVCGGSPTSASFLAMWMAMMVPMMLPSLAPALWRYRLAIAGGGRVRWAGLALTAGLGNALGVALIGLVYYTHGFAGSLVYLAASAMGVAILWRFCRL